MCGFLFNNIDYKYINMNVVESAYISINSNATMTSISYISILYKYNCLFSMNQHINCVVYYINLHSHF